MKCKNKNVRNRKSNNIADATGLREAIDSDKQEDAAAG